MSIRDDINSKREGLRNSVRDAVGVKGEGEPVGGGTSDKDESRSSAAESAAGELASSGSTESADNTTAKDAGGGGKGDDGATRTAASPTPGQDDKGKKESGGTDVSPASTGVTGAAAPPGQSPPPVAPAKPQQPTGGRGKDHVPYQEFARVAAERKSLREQMAQRDRELLEAKAELRAWQAVRQQSPTQPRPDQYEGGSGGDDLLDEVLGVPGAQQQQQYAQGQPGQPAEQPWQKAVREAHEYARGVERRYLADRIQTELSNMLPEYGDQEQQFLAGQTMLSYIQHKHADNMTEAKRLYDATLGIQRRGFTRAEEAQIAASQEVAAAVAPQVPVQPSAAEQSAPEAPAAPAAPPRPRGIGGGGGSGVTNNVQANNVRAAGEALKKRGGLLGMFGRR